MSIIYKLLWMQGNAKTPLPRGLTIRPSPIKINTTKPDFVSVMSFCEASASGSPELTFSLIWAKSRPHVEALLPSPSYMYFQYALMKTLKCNMSLPHFHGGYQCEIFFIFGWLCCELLWPLRKTLIDSKDLQVLKLVIFNPLMNIGQLWLFIWTLSAVKIKSAPLNKSTLHYEWKYRQNYFLCSGSKF